MPMPASVAAATLRKRHFLAAEDDPAAVGRVEPGENFEERRLAGTVLADEADDLVRPDLDRHVVERLEPGEALAQILDAQHRLAHLTTRSRLRRCQVAIRIAVRMMPPCTDFCT